MEWLQTRLRDADARLSTAAHNHRQSHMATFLKAVANCLTAMQQCLPDRNAEAVKPQVAVKAPQKHVKLSDHKGVALLMALDDRFAAALKSGAIKLIRADFMKQSTQPHLLRRQDLEALERDEQIAVFLKPDEAVALLRSNTRGIAALTYGWVTPDHPDVTDEYLANMRRFLNHPRGAHIGGCFWDFGSLPQRPRTDAEKKIFDQALGCMGDVYASAMGTTVVRHKTIPKRPARLDGELVVLVDGGDVVTAEQEAALTAELAKHGAVESVRREPGRLRVRLASHAAAEAAVAAGVAGAVAVFPFWNAREYEVRPCHSPLPNSLHSPPFLSLLQNRGWCCLETGVSGEAIACAQHFKGLDAVLKRLPPKIIEIDGDGPREADADEVGGGEEGRGPRIERVRASIKAATSLMASG